ncbi:hypothetical protein OG906_31335 [Streptomyces sp. NBC_01426]|uniref:hypothetical protein n=1 Tax=Streptomyces sp. NBC_01426 TaxID=2975866 RepID=UPI002E36AAA6|nr:hypothetical protein [Streptomyces sp. NBC_01426]
MTSPQRRLVVWPERQIAVPTTASAEPVTVMSPCPYPATVGTTFQPLWSTSTMPMSPSRALTLPVPFLFDVPTRVPSLP